MSRDDTKALRSYVAYAQSVARKSTLEVFELGKRMRDARERLPGRYEDWIKRELTGITVRTAQNYVSVHDAFDHRREEVVALGLKPTALYALADASPPAVEEVLERAAQGERMTGAVVGQIIRLHAEPSDEPDPVSRADQGGPKGIRALLAERSAHWQREWTTRATDLLNVLEVLVPPGASDFLTTKPEVDKAVGPKAQWLGIELSRMTGAHFFNKAEQRLGMGYMEGRDWPSEPWKLLHLSLGCVGAAGAHTKSRLFEEVAGALLPRLRWALGKGPLPLALDDSALSPDEG